MPFFAGGGPTRAICHGEALVVPGSVNARYHDYTCIHIQVVHAFSFHVFPTLNFSREYT